MSVADPTLWVTIERTWVSIRMLTLFTLLMSVSYGHADGQEVTSGIVFGLPDGKPLAYANIGILNSSTGTISDLDGSFSLNIEAEHRRDSVVFSALGYAPLKLAVKNMVASSNVRVYLSQNVYELEEIVISEKRSRRRILSAGNGHYMGGTLYADTVQAGASMAILIDNHSRKGREKYTYPMYIQGAQVMIINNTFDDFKVRVRVLDAVEKNGKISPGEDLLQRSVVVESTLFEGWLKFDLSEFRLKVNGDFFLAFEWILEKKDRVNLHRQYHQFRRKNPDKIIRNSSFVDGSKISYDNYQGNFYFGTSFGISTEHTVIRDFPCFYRHNSFGLWYPSPTVLCAKVGLSATPSLVSTEGKLMKEIPAINHVLSHAVLPSSEKNPADIENVPISFYSRMREPVALHVKREVNKFIFYALNDSPYPYEIELSFSNMHNLTPLISKKRVVAYPGKTKLHAFDVIFPELGNYHYELAVKETIGDSQLSPHIKHPYLLPFANRARLLLYDSTERAAMGPDLFAISTGDTVYTSRGGTVASMYQDSVSMDRISSQHAIEVLHEDGTVMTYENIDILSQLVEIGEEVVPNQPIAVVGNQAFLKLNLFQVAHGESLKTLPIYYENNGSLPMRYSDLTHGSLIGHSAEIISMKAKQ